MAIDASDERLLNRTLEVVIRIGLVLALFAWCFAIVRPFVGPVAWATIIAVALHPVHRRLRARLGGSGRAAAGLLVLAGLALLLVPTWMLGGTVIEGAQGLAQGFKEGRIRIPELPESVAAWPLVGEQISSFWADASHNIVRTLRSLEPQLIALGGWLLSSAASGGVTLVLFVVSIVIAGILLANAEAGRRAALSIGARLTGERSEEFLDLARATVQSVAQGILGVSLIQSLLAALGFLVAGLPGAGLWALAVLLFCVIQIGAFVVLVPVLVWAWATMTTTGAVLFTIYCAFVGLIDNFLKPLLLGRGVKVPTLVIFLGAIGGFLSSGIIGLFVGSVVLVLGYTLLMAWLGIPPVEPEVGAG